MEKRKIRVLFLCTGNSCRSQMAEGWARYLHGDTIEPYSAGVEPRGIDPKAVKVMKEEGIDISKHRSKHLKDLSHLDFDYVITVCDHARETCPVFPGKTKLFHKSFPDPPRLAQEAKSEEEALNLYRSVRDQIRDFVQNLPEFLKKEKGHGK